MNRERLKTLRDHLAGLPDERVDMRHYFTVGNGWTAADPAALLEAGCGTAACIAGWAASLFQGQPEDANDLLDLTEMQEQALCYPTGFQFKGTYNRLGAIAAIDSMLANPDDLALPVWPEKAVSA
ncbi:hypothetical protein [Brevundimonas sp. GCM10030266]|uniref:hypothetical protein n=1 Tax=Brevundimonas sp. GCM10030266 TaxID=3273386 RepID=UPI003608168F